MLSFIYDDIESIHRYLICWFSSSRRFVIEGERNEVIKSLRRSMPAFILDSCKVFDVFCRICMQPVCYPYKLRDESCGHIVCGRCAWVRHQSLKPCGCGVRIKLRPQRLHTWLADCRAYWMLRKEGKSVKTKALECFE